jgi:hypothetical protein
MKLEFSRKIFEKVSNIKFHQNTTMRTVNGHCGERLKSDKKTNLSPVFMPHPVHHGNVQVSFASRMRLEINQMRKEIISCKGNSKLLLRFVSTIALLAFRRRKPVITILTPRKRVSWMAETLVPYDSTLLSTVILPCSRSGLCELVQSTCY